MKEHGAEKPTLTDNFSVLKKCRNEFKSLVYEILFIQKLKPSLNIESDSIRAKLFYQIHLHRVDYLQHTTVYPSHLPTGIFFLSSKTKKNSNGQMRCIYPYAANESTHNNEARTNAILFIQTTPLLTTLKLYTLDNDVPSIGKSSNAFLSSNFLVKSAASTELTIGLKYKIIFSPQMAL